MNPTKDRVVQNELFINLLHAIELLLIERLDVYGKDHDKSQYIKCFLVCESTSLIIDNPGLIHQQDRFMGALHALFAHVNIRMIYNSLFTMNMNQVEDFKITSSDIAYPKSLTLRIKGIDHYLKDMFNETRAERNNRINTVIELLEQNGSIILEQYSIDSRIISPLISILKSTSDTHYFLTNDQVEGLFFDLIDGFKSNTTKMEVSLPNRKVILNLLPLYEC